MKIVRRDQVFPQFHFEIFGHIFCFDQSFGHEKFFRFLSSGSRAEMTHSFALESKMENPVNRT